jgi:hypothetical protein
MRTKNKNASKKTESAPEKGLSEPENGENRSDLGASEPEIAPSRKTIGWSLTPEGRIDFDRMREKTKQELRDLIDDPEVRKAVGAKNSEGNQQTAQPVEFFDPAWCKPLFDTFAQVETMVIAPRLKLPADIVFKQLRFNKEELDALTPVTCRVINKYAMEWMIRFKDEIGLAMLLTTISIAHIRALAQIKADLDAQVKPTNEESQEAKI